MNVEGWQAGLFLGSAFALVLEAVARALLRWRERRAEARHPRCWHCDGFLNEACNRAEFPVECLKVCAVCGDTWPASVVDRTLQAHREGRGAELPALRAVARRVTTCGHGSLLEGAACDECEEEE